MTISVANVDQTSDSFGGWIAKTNQIATALSTKIVTTDSNTTTGNATISNAFTANIVYANNVVGGNSSSGSANLTLASNVVINPYAGNVMVVVGNSTTGSYQTTITGNTVLISPSANATVNSALFTVSTANVNITSNTKITGNTFLYGYSGSQSLSVTGNSTVTNVVISTNSTIINSVTSINGNSTIQANSTTNNIKVTGNTTYSNVNITANDVYLTPSSNVNVTSLLNVSNTVFSGNTTVTGFAEVSSYVNSALITVGTSLTANTTGVYHTGTMNAASFSTSGTNANASGVYPTSNSTGRSLGSAARRWILTANTIDATGLVSAGAGIDVTGTANVSSDINVIGVSNITGNLNVTGITTLSNTLNTGNTTVTGFANVSSSLQVSGNTTLNGNLVLGSASVAVALIANGSSGSAGQVLTSNSSASYWINPSALNVVNTQAQYIFSNTITIDRSAGTGDNELLIKSQNTAGVTIQGDSLNTGNSTNSGAYLRIGVDGIANIALLSVIQDAGTNGIGNTYTDTLANTVLLGSLGTRSLQLGTANAVVTTITTGGNTGFGNTAPAHKVRVEGTFSALTSVQVGTAFTANTTGLFHTGSVNTATITVGSAVSANSTGLYPASNSVGSALGTSTSRWIFNANTISATGLITGSNGLTITGAANVSGLITGSSGLIITGTANVSSDINVGANAVVNTTSFFVGNSTVNTNITSGTISISGATINSTSYTGTSNNSLYLGGTIAASYVKNTDSRTLSGNLTFTGISAFTGNVAIGARADLQQGYTESMSNATVSSTTYTVDWNARNVYNLTLANNVTFTFSNPPAAGKMQALTIIVTQDATGSRTITWPASVRWSYNSAPVITTTANRRDVFSFITIDGGTTYAGAYSMANVAIS